MWLCLDGITPSNWDQESFTHAIVLIQKLKNVPTNSKLHDPTLPGVLTEGVNILLLSGNVTGGGDE
jgi:hypothetical protein